jgi:hypothetical protein
MKTVVPATAETRRSVSEEVDERLPAFPTDQVRGLKAHGITVERRKSPGFRAFLTDPRALSL